MFGKGFASYIFGSALYVWPCKILEATIDLDHPHLTEDIPVVIHKDGKMIKTYADHTNFRLKNNTLIFPKSKIFTPSYYINGLWYCWGNSLQRCNIKPAKISINTTAIRESLKSIMENTRFDGGFTSYKDRAENRRNADLPSRSTNILFDIGARVIMNDLEGIQDTFQIPYMKESLLESISRKLLTHPLTINMLMSLAVGGIIFIVYVIWTCLNIFHVKKKRNNKNDKMEKKFSKKNYFHALFSHAQLDVNINKETISELNNEIAQLRVAIHNVSKHISKEYESKLI